MHNVLVWMSARIKTVLRTARELWRRLVPARADACEGIDSQVEWSNGCKTPSVATRYRKSQLQETFDDWRQKSLTICRRLQTDGYDRTWRDTTDLLSCVPRKGFADTAKAAMVAICIINSSVLY